MDGKGCALILIEAPNGLSISNNSSGVGASTIRKPPCSFEIIPWSVTWPDSISLIRWAKTIFCTGTALIGSKLSLIAISTWYFT